MIEHFPLMKEYITEKREHQQNADGNPSLPDETKRNRKEERRDGKSENGKNTGSLDYKKGDDEEDIEENLDRGRQVLTCNSGLRFSVQRPSVSSVLIENIS